MPKADTLLDEAIEIGKQELRAINANDEVKAAQLAEKRSALIQAAWEQRHDCDPKVYKAKLLQLQSMQKFLTNVVQEQKNTSGKNVVRARKETKRMDGYKKAMSYT